MQLNPVLLHVLKEEYGCDIEIDNLLNGNGEETNELLDLESAFCAFSEATKSINGFSIQKDRKILANFFFQKMAIIKELQDNLDSMVYNLFISSIAGDEGARELLRNKRVSQEIDPRTFDSISPDDEFFILDADSSQLKVINTVLKGENVVIQGPPGTGKSQTIANMIAALVAKGSKVLFVAEKRAALEVVLGRLRDVGLGHIVLDLHGADVSRREVMKQLRESLDVVKSIGPVDTKELHTSFSQRRKSLNDHVARLHTPNLPSGYTIYEIQGRLLNLPKEAETHIRWRGKSLKALTQDKASKIMELLREAGDSADLFLKIGPSPWASATLRNGEDVMKAIDTVSAFKNDYLPDMWVTIDGVTSLTGFFKPGTLEEFTTQLSLLEDVHKIGERYNLEIFREDLRVHLENLEPAKRGSLASFWAKIANRDFRTSLKVILKSRKNRDASSKQILREVIHLAEVLRRWRLFAGSESLPTKVTHIDKILLLKKKIILGIYYLQRSLSKKSLREIPLQELEEFINNLDSDNSSAYKIPRLMEIEEELTSLGAEEIFKQIKRCNPMLKLWPRIFEYAWLSSCLDDTHAKDKNLSNFNGKTHNRVVEDFCELDKERLKYGRERVKREHGKLVIETQNSFPDQNELVTREIRKQSRHLPLRKLFTRAPDVMTSLCPCWMASPLSVSQLIDSKSCCFDVVIFDEASQVLPEDAMPAIFRGAQVVVVGDRNQLPPTTFLLLEMMRIMRKRMRCLQLKALKVS